MERTLYTYGAIVSLGAIGFAGYELIDWRCLTATEWAAWIGAIGTLLAFAGTIWIATSQRRDRARREHARAIIKAPEAKIIALHLRARIDKAGVRLKSHHDAYVVNGEMDHDLLDQCARLIEQIELWSGDDLSTFAEVSSDLAIELAVIKIQIDTVIRYLRFDMSLNLEGFAYIDHVNFGLAELSKIRKRVVAINDPLDKLAVNSKGPVKLFD